MQKRTNSIGSLPRSAQHLLRAVGKVGQWVGATKKTIHNVVRKVQRQ